MEDQDKERAEFEAWANSIGHALKLTKDGTYKFTTARNCLEAWQASAARSASRIAELEAEVERLKADADRYLFLRSVDFLSGEELKKPFIHAAEMDGNFWGLHGEIADKKIDEAMKGGV